MMAQRNCKLIFMRLLKNISSCDIYENFVLYVFKGDTKSKMQKFLSCRKLDLLLINSIYFVVCSVYLYGGPLVSFDINLNMKLNLKENLSLKLNLNLKLTLNLALNWNLKLSLKLNSKLKLTFNLNLKSRLLLKLYFHFYLKFVS